MAQHGGNAIRGQRVEPHVLSVDVALTGRTLLMNDPDNVRGRLAPPFRKFGAESELKFGDVP